jgi:hypothetical protein
MLEFSAIEALDAVLFHLFVMSILLWTDTELII